MIIPGIGMKIVYHDKIYHVIDRDFCKGTAIVGIEDSGFVFETFEVFFTEIEQKIKS